MISTKKLLAIVITAFAFTLCFGSNVFAAELKDTSTDLTQKTTVITAATGSAVTIDNSTEEQTETSDESNVVDSDDLDLLLQDGYYLNEQGQICYEKPTKEETEAEAEAEEEEEAEKKAVVKKKKPTYSESDLRLLSALIYTEAGNQNYNGMLAVANVVLNRVKSNAYWHVDTIEEVIYDRKWSVQFAVTIKSKSTGSSILGKALKYYDTRKFPGANPEASKKSMDKAIKAAKAALEGKNNIGSLLCFQNKRVAKSIKRKYSDYKVIDDHIFYRSK